MGLPGHLLGNDGPLGGESKDPCGSTDQFKYHVSNVRIPGRVDIRCTSLALRTAQDEYYWACLGTHRRQLRR